MTTDGSARVRGWQHDLAPVSQLAAMVQFSQDAIIGKDLNGMIISWNPGAERLYGYRPPEVLGQPSSLLIDEAHRGLESTMLTRIAAGQNVEPFRTRRVHKSGTVVEVSVSAWSIVDVDNAIVGVTTASRDVGDLAAAQAWSQSLLEAAPDGMVCVNSDGIIMLVNNRLEQLFGYRRAELIGRPVELLIPASLPKALPVQQDSFFEAPETRASGTTELYGQRKDGSSFPADLSLSWAPIGGQLIAIAAAPNVSDGAAAAAALAESETLFRHLAESVDVAFILHNLHPSEFLYVSPGFEKIYGYQPMTERKDPEMALRRVVHPEDWERVRTGYWVKVTKAIAAQDEFRIIRPDGEVRWVRVTTNPVVDSDGIVRRTAGTGQDITDRKLAEAVLQRATVAQQRAEALAAANAAKNDFLSRMSHELRTPLNAVLGFAQLLALDDLTADQHAAVQQISNGGQHLVGLIDDVLDIAKIESDQLNVSIESVPLSELIDDAIRLVKPLADAAGVRLENHSADNARLSVLADQRRLRQVLLNLLSNAIKYNRPGGRVSISTALSGNLQVGIAVIDTGLGIRSDRMPRLFTPFDRLGMEATCIEGTGVGLALSRRLMTTMGGSLTAESEEGTGSTFTATLPTALDPRPATPNPAVARSTIDPTDSDTPPPGREKASTVLYIEDNIPNIHLMEQLIGRMPRWQLLTAGNGALGVELAASDPPDLVLLDLNLPDIDGVEVLRRLKALPGMNRTGVVVVSADANPQQIENVLQAGADGYLTKPMVLRELFDVLDSAANTASTA